MSIIQAFLQSRITLPLRLLDLVPYSQMCLRDSASYQLPGNFSSSRVHNQDPFFYDDILAINKLENFLSF